MLGHVYIDNFRCLVNFELALGQQQLIWGLNGSGKSTLLDALRAVKDLVVGEGQPDVLFPHTSRTRWQSVPQQTFELQVKIDASYRFRLELETWEPQLKTRIRREVVLCDERPVFEFIDGEVHLFNDSFQHKVTYPFNWFQSALKTIQPRPENALLMHFKDWMSNLQCRGFNPHAMSKLSEREESKPSPDMSNFASWYRYVSQEQGAAASMLQQQLSQIIPGLESLNLAAAGANSRTLAANFSLPNAGNPRAFYQIAFDELSDGQRVLIALYALLNFAVNSGSCLFLDEPENFIAIPEIQPWLMELRDRLEERGGQVILASHHPEMVDYLAPEFGLVFERTGPGAVRVHKYSSDGILPPSEQMARGWLSNA